ncbi:MAG: HAD family hydrolase [Deltaproteobacteria bacterium]|nr:HAD family hydrolase [Deltaproteobacteria bacterium]
MRIKTVIFDYGNTLVSTQLDWPSIVPQSLVDLRAALEAELPSLDYPRLGRDFLFFRAEGKERARRDWLETRATESLKKALALQGKNRPSEELLQQGVDGFFSAEERCYLIIQGMPALLAKLKNMGLKLGLLSNATSASLVRRALENRQMLNFFDDVVISAEEGICKPEPELFRTSLHRLDSHAEQCAMVGDLVETDIAGARRAGMRAILVDLLGLGTHIKKDDPKPDAVAQSPQQLLALLEAWSMDLL